jgi:hypothetical protein
MKLDRRHMAAALVLLVGSIIYNVYVFWGPGSRAATTAGASAAPPADGATNAPEASGGPVDPSQITPPEDVALDRLPEWPRDPFLNRRVPDQTAVVDASAPEAPAAEPNPVVSTILYSAGRRRAVIDGHIVGVGDRVGTATVADILPNAVVIDSPVKGRLVLELRPPMAGLVGR